MASTKTVIKRLPPGWSIHFGTEDDPFEEAGLPPARTLILHRGTSRVLVECDGRFMILNYISGYVSEILEPTRIDDILNEMVEGKKLNAVRIIDEYTDPVPCKSTFGAKANQGIKYEFDLRACSGWTDDGPGVGQKMYGFSEKYGLPPATLLLYNEKSSKYLVESEFRYFTWNTTTNGVFEIVNPKTYEEIDKALGDDSKLETQYLKAKDSD